MNMAKTNNKHFNNGLTKKQTENVVSIRVLVLVLFDIIVSFMFDYLTHASELVGETGFTAEGIFVLKVRPVLMWVFGALFAASLAYFVVAKVTKLNTSRHPVTPAMLTAMTFILTAGVVFYNTFRIAPVLFYTMTVIISLLVALYYIYTMLFY